MVQIICCLQRPLLAVMSPFNQQIKTRMAYPEDKIIKLSIDNAGHLNKMLCCSYRVACKTGFPPAHRLIFPTPHLADDLLLKLC